MTRLDAVIDVLEEHRELLTRDERLAVFRVLYPCIEDFCEDKRLQYELGARPGTGRYVIYVD